MIDDLLIVLSGSEQKRIQDLTKKILACKLLSSLYSTLQKDFLHTSGSQIAKKAFEHLVNRGAIKRTDFNGTEMGKFLLQKLVSIRSEILDGSQELKEFFR